MIKILENYEIKNETTFRIGGKAKKIAFPETCDELIDLISSGEYELIFGNCSNVLFSSNNINKNIILTKNISKYSINEDEVYVSCGTRGPIVAKECIEKSLTGFEFLVGFPGSFGGMITMNASAHNQAISDSFVECRVYDIEKKEIKTLNKNEMNFEYRKSITSGSKYIILDAKFKLKLGDKKIINEMVNRNIEFRKSRQPSLVKGNAGSIFKNPENDSAGRLLDLCKMKGTKVGGAMVYENHANFIINDNNATSLDVLTLMYKMYSKVKEKYTIELKPEIMYIGDEETEEQEIWQLITQ